MNKRKILWPFDPYGNHKNIDDSIRLFFNSLTKVVEYEVQPVYVLSSTFFTTSDYFEPIDMAALQKNVYEHCQEYLTQFSEFPISDPVVIDHNYSSSVAEVSLLRDYVTKNRPDFVLIASQGRSGWERGVMGSFCESFLISSEVPVVVIGKHCRKDVDLARAIMPVEIDNQSQQFLERFLDDHRLEFVDDLTLFHKISFMDLEDIAWAPTLYGLSDFTTADIIDRAKGKVKDYLSAFLDHPLSRKRLSYKISETLGPVADEIENQVSADSYGMVIMKSNAGFLEANFLGSITRDLIRQSTVPVVVYPHKFQAK